MTEQLKELAILPEELSSVPSTHARRLTDIPNSSSEGSGTSLLHWHSHSRAHSPTQTQT